MKISIDYFVNSFKKRKRIMSTIKPYLLEAKVKSWINWLKESLKVFGAAIITKSKQKSFQRNTNTYEKQPWGRHDLSLTSADLWHIDCKNNQESHQQILANLSINDNNLSLAV